jgi:hypothetical protein
MKHPKKLMVDKRRGKPQSPLHLRIFLVSPGDLADERPLARRLRAYLDAVRSAHCTREQELCNE